LYFENGRLRKGRSLDFFAHFVTGMIVDALEASHPFIEHGLIFGQKDD
jgi:hypothetical protein